MTVASPQFHFRKALPVLLLGWVAFYAIYIWFLRPWAGETGTHLKVALFCSVLTAWWLLALSLAPRVHSLTIAARIGIVFLTIVLLVILTKVLRTSLATDPVWHDVLRNPVAALLPVMLFWTYPPARPQN